MSRYIKDWEDLKKIPNESETHILKVGEYNAWLEAKTKRLYNSEVDYLEQVKHLDVYLSTHTFYDPNYEFSTKILQACGFDVELANWDE